MEKKNFQVVQRRTATTLKVQETENRPLRIKETRKDKTLIAGLVRSDKERSVIL